MLQRPQTNYVSSRPNCQNYDMPQHNQYNTYNIPNRKNSVDSLSLNSPTNLQYIQQSGHYTHINNTQQNHTNQLQNSLSNSKTQQIQPLAQSKVKQSTTPFKYASPNRQPLGAFASPQHQQQQKQQFLYQSPQQKKNISCQLGYFNQQIQSIDQSRNIQLINKQINQDNIKQSLSPCLDYFSTQTNQIQSPLPNPIPPIISTFPNGIVAAYAACTNQGVIRDYNEDRVSLILNITQPINKIHENWPKSSFFGIYDGHGGAQCANYLRDNLHHFVIQQSSFPKNPIDAIRSGFSQAEKSFTQFALQSNDKSGSCAIVALIVGDICYLANVGDSRAVMSFSGGQGMELSRDHKPSDEQEQQRIAQAGGQIYQTNMQTEQGEYPVGPLRVFPGRLSVSRTFGDIEAKLTQFGGIPNVVISEPEITVLKIKNEHEFLILGCDGIFDQMKSQESIDQIWKIVHDSDEENINKILGQGVENLLHQAILNESTDNVTGVVICFKDLRPKIRERTTVGSRSIKDKTSSILSNMTNIHQEQMGFSISPFLKDDIEKSQGKKQMEQIRAMKENLNLLNIKQKKETNSYFIN